MNMRFFYGFLSFALVFLFCLFKQTEGDYFTHLSNGRYILQNKHIPTVDILTYTAKGVEWVNHEWLFGLLLYLGHEYLGFSGVTIVKGLLYALIFLLVYRILIYWNVDYRIGAFLIILGAAVGRFRLFTRPQLASAIFLTIYLFIITTKRNKGILWWLLMPVLMILWCNMHAVCIMGPLIVGFSIFCEIIEKLLIKLKVPPEKCSLIGERDIKGSLTVLMKIIILVLIYAAMFANPNGYKVPFYIFNVTGQHHASQIQEWQPIYAVPDREIWWIAFGIFILVWIFTIWKTPFFLAILGLGATLAPLKALRNVDLWIVLGVPVMAYQLNILIKFIKERLKSSLWKSQNLAHSLAIIGILAIVFITYFTPWGDMSYLYPFGTGFNSVIYPVNACDLLDKFDLPGRVFNTDTYGGYCAWRYFPKREIFWDGRAEVNGIVLDEMRKIGLDKMLDKYQINIAIVDYRSVVSIFPDWFLKAKPVWALIFLDDRTMVFARRIEELKELINQYEYKYYDPMLDLSIVDPSLLDPIYQELTTKEHFEENSQLKSLALGVIAWRKGNFNEAEKLIQKSIKLLPDSASAHLAMCDLFYSQGNLTLALKYALNAKRAKILDYRTHFYLGKIYRALRQPKKAIAHFEKFAKEFPDALPAQEELLALYQEKVDDVKATKTGWKVKELIERDINAKLAQAFLLAAIMDIPRADAIMAQLQSSLPLREDIALARAAIFENALLYHNAEQIYNEILQSNPSSAFCLLRQGLFYAVKIKDRDKAVEVFKKYLSLFKQSSDAPLGTLIDAYISDDKFELEKAIGESAKKNLTIEK